MTAFLDELMKIAAEARGPQDAPKTVGAPRMKLSGEQVPKAPTTPGKLSPKLVMPGSKYGKQQKYSQPNKETPPTTNPAQGVTARQLQPPNVVFGVR